MIESMEIIYIFNESIKPDNHFVPQLVGATTFFTQNCLIWISEKFRIWLYKLYLAYVWAKNRAFFGICFALKNVRANFVYLFCLNILAILMDIFRLNIALLAIFSHGVFETLHLFLAICPQCIVPLCATWEHFEGKLFAGKHRYIVL